MHDQKLGHVWIEWPEPFSNGHTIIHAPLFHVGSQLRVL
jgi:hypothetical protein